MEQNQAIDEILFMLSVLQNPWKKLNLFFLHTRCQSLGLGVAQSSANLPLLGGLWNQSTQYPLHTDKRTPDPQKESIVHSNSETLTNLD